MLAIDPVRRCLQEALALSCLPNVIPSSEAATFYDATSCVHHLKAEAGYLLYCLRRLDMDDGDCLAITQALERIEDTLRRVGRDIPEPKESDDDPPF